MSNKKGKKSKGVTMSLQDFAMKVEEDAGHSTPGSGQNVVYADKKPKQAMISSWADEVEEDGSFFEKERLILPSAPRAARGPAYEDHLIPKNPPFTAHLGNLPYDISDEEIYKFFRDLGVDELKLPRDQQTNRLRGFGYIDFLTREDLIEALIRNEQTLRGRPIRITLGNGQQQDRRGGDMDRGMRGGDGERRGRRPPAEDDDVDDWRSVMKPQGFEGEGEPDFRRGPPSGPGDYGSMPRSGGYNRDRGYGPPRGGPRGPPPDEELDFSRSSMMQGPPPGPPPQHYNTYGGRGSGPRGGGYQQRDRDFYDGRGGDRYGGDRDQGFYRGGGGGPPSGPPSMHNYPPSSHSRHHSESSDAETGGTWRRGREHTISQRSDSSSHNYGPPSSSYVPPHHQRSESPPMRRAMSPGSDYGPPSRGPHRDREEDNDSPPPPQPQAPKERKRLVLQPRTVDKPVGEADVASASIFGGAKPVDTTKREREIEEKLEKLKVDVPPKEETESSELVSGGEDGESQSGAPPRQPRSERGERERGGPPEGRPKQFRLLTRNNSGSNGKDAYIDVEAPFESLKGSGLTSSSSAPSSSRSRLPMQAPPPLGQAYTSQRFSQLRSDDKDRDRGLDRDRGDRSGPYRGGRGGPSRRGGDMDRGPRGGGDFRRRDHDGPPSGRGGGRSFDDHVRPSRGGRGGYGGGRDDYRGDRDDYRRSHHNNNQSSSIGSQSEERDRDSHSEPEDDRDMMRGGGEKTGGDFSDDSGDFTRVERRGRKFNNRVNNNPNPNNNRQTGGEPRPRQFY